MTDVKHLFIINPLAGGHDRTEEIRALTAEIFEPGEDYELFTTSYAGEAVVAVRAYAEKYPDLRVYSVGGDGTLNECVNGAAGHDNVAITCFPGGTGNDFVRMFEGERERFFDLRSLVRGEIHPIDLIECNGHYGVNTCSVGIDARVGVHVHDYTKYPLIGGSAAYVCSMVVNVLKGINQPMEVKFGSRCIKGQIALVNACNGRYYGGGFNPAPDARPDDGLIDFFVVQNLTMAKLPPLLLKYAKGRYKEISDKYLIHHRGREMTISSPEELCISIDGEGYTAREVTLRMIPGGAKFIFPSQMAFFENQ